MFHAEKITSKINFKNHAREVAKMFRVNHPKQKGNKHKHEPWLFKWSKNACEQTIKLSKKHKKKFFLTNFHYPFKSLEPNDSSCKKESVFQAGF